MLTQRPFLKWAGNNYQLLPRILALLPSSGSRFIEPFAGSGAVSLNALHNQYQFDEWHVGDSNHHLVETYQMAVADASGFVDRLHILFQGIQDPTHPVPHGNDRAQFEHLRRVFNQQTQDPHLSHWGIGIPELFVYLNRHAFNGLCCYNGSGKFNVPFGRFKAPGVPDAEIQAFQQIMKPATFHLGDYTTLLDSLKPGPGDVVYLDPPYLPLSTTANFTAYSNDGGFDMAKQTELADIAHDLAKKGATVLVSNHDTPVARALYQNASTIDAFMAARFIGAKSRQGAPELLALFT